MAPLQARTAVCSVPHVMRNDAAGTALASGAGGLPTQQEKEVGAGKGNLGNGNPDGIRKLLKYV
jgi:hypothetical protein